MEKHELERRLQSLTKENQELKNLKAAQDAQILKLQQELEEQRKNFAFLNTFSSIYETNSKYDDINANLEISLTDVASNLQAKGIILFQKQPNGNFHGINASIQIVSNNTQKKDEDILKFMQSWQIDSELPSDILEYLKTCTKHPKIIHLDNLSHNNINSITFIQIITDGEVRYLLGIINPKYKIDNSLLELISIGYADVLKRIEQENLTHTLSITDNMTGVYNRRYYNMLKDSLTNGSVSSIGVIVADLFRLKYVNDNFGHTAGDIYIKTMANILTKHFGNDRIFRIGGDEFVIIIVDKDYQYISDCLEALEKDIANLKLTDSFGNELLARLDTGVEYAYGEFNYDDIMHKADIKMNKNKSNYYKKLGIDRRK